MQEDATVPQRELPYNKESAKLKAWLQFILTFRGTDGNNAFRTDIFITLWAHLSFEREHLKTDNGFIYVHGNLPLMGN